MDARAVAMAMQTIVGEEAFLGAIETVVGIETAQHLDQMRVHVRANDIAEAMKCEARAEVWQNLLGVFQTHARKYRPAGE